MIFIKKKGQFFFVATLIIVTLLLTLVNVYNQTSYKENDYNYQYLASDIKFEGLNIINNGYFNNQSFDIIRDNLINFTLLYSINFPYYNISILTGDYLDSTSYKVTSFSGGKITNLPSNILISGNNITLDLNSLKFNFDINRGFNLRVFVIEENEYGRFVGSK